VSSKGRFGIVDTLLCVIVLAVACWLYMGFFRPDPAVVHDGNLVQAVVLVLFPAIMLGIFWFYWAVRTKRIPGTVAASLIGVLVVCLLFLFPVAVWMLDKPEDPAKLAQYHPYLQLTPNKHTEREASADAPALKVFCLGGSTTEWENSQHTGWPEIAEEKLASSVPGRTVQVYNEGRQWYTSQHTLINYMLNLRQYKPDVIIVMHALNDMLINADFCRFSNAEFEPDYRHFYGPVTRLIKHETMFASIKNKIAPLWNFPGREKVTTTEFPGLEPFKRNLQTLIDIARLDGTKVVLMTEPYLFKTQMTPEELARLGMLNTEAIGPTKQWTLETVLSGMEQYDGAIRELANQPGVYLIDLETAVPKTTEYFADDVHYRDPAFPIVGSFVASELTRQGILSPAAASTELK
jgi:hypothetical protein